MKTLNDIIASFDDDGDGLPSIQVLWSGQSSWDHLVASTINLDATRIGDFNGDGRDDIIASFFSEL